MIYQSFLAIWLAHFSKVRNIKKEILMEKEKVNERVVLHKTHNAETIEIRNPSEKLLAFMDELAERARKRKEEIMKKIYKEEDYITI